MELCDLFFIKEGESMLIQDTTLGELSFEALSLNKWVTILPTDDKNTFNVRYPIKPRHRDIARMIIKGQGIEKNATTCYTVPSPKKVAAAIRLLDDSKLTITHSDTEIMISKRKYAKHGLDLSVVANLNIGDELLFKLKPNVNINNIRSCIYYLSEIPVNIKVNDSKTLMTVTSTNRKRGYTLRINTFIHELPFNTPTVVPAELLETGSFLSALGNSHYALTYRKGLLAKYKWKKIRGKAEYTDGLNRFQGTLGELFKEHNLKDGDVCIK